MFSVSGQVPGALECATLRGDEFVAQATWLSSVRSFKLSALREPSDMKPVCKMYSVSLSKSTAVDLLAR